MPPKSHSFWISYSDLSTGLMMVFLLVTIVFALKQLMLEHAKKMEVRELVNDVSAKKMEVRELVNDVSDLTTMRLRLARELNEKLDGLSGVEVDLVTAQVTVEHDALGFEPGEAIPRDTGFLQMFIGPYSCALIAFEHAHCHEGCERLDPRNPKAIRRILVTGHADLVAGFVHNRSLAADRAENVIQASLEVAKNIQCEEVPVASYLESRLQPAAAGQIAHCLEEMDGDTRTLCSDLPDSRRSPSERHRTVTFEVELVGEDLSGMALNLVALDATVSGNAATDELLLTLEPMIDACVRGERPSSECAPIRIDSDPLLRSQRLRTAVARACQAAAEAALDEYCP